MAPAAMSLQDMLRSPDISHIQDEDLPASFRREPADVRKDVLTLVVPSRPNLAEFLELDLSVRRLDAIHEHLWMTGRPYPPRPLNYQLVLDRVIIPTSDISLHLVWTSKKIFLKPIPLYLLSPDNNTLLFELPRQEVVQEQRPSQGAEEQAAQDHENQGPNTQGVKRGIPKVQVEQSFQMGKAALGLLYTYLALMPTQLDFAIAEKHNLLPKGYQWRDWKHLTNRVLTNYPNDEIYKHVSPRYIYGELRLSRLDKIYRTVKFRSSWQHGYSTLAGKTRYVDLLSENLGYIGAATIYLVLILSAMQVGLNGQPLDGNGQQSPGGETFENVSFNFAVFSIIVPVVSVSLIVGSLGFLAIANLWKTRAHQHARRQQLGMSAEDPSYIGLLANWRANV